MGDFTVIETQEQFEEALKDRLARERSAVAKQYEGYMSPDDVNKKFEGYLSKKEVDEMYKGYASPDEVAKKDAIIKGYETNSVKMRIAHENGIPFELANRLSGDNEEEIKKDAENMSKFISMQSSLPLATNETQKPDNKTAALKNLLTNIKGE